MESFLELDVPLGTWTWHWFTSPGKHQHEIRSRQLPPPKTPKSRGGNCPCPSNIIVHMV